MPIRLTNGSIVVDGGQVSISPPPIITTDLVIWFDAGDTSSYPGSGTTWYDLSGNNNDGTISGTPTLTNGYFVFNGTQYASVSISSITNTFTYEVWAYSDGASSYRTLIDQDNDNWLFYTFGNRPGCYGPNYVASIILTNYIWYHLVMTHTSGGPVRIYVDGVKYLESSNDSTSHTTSNIGFGSGIPGPNEGWSGGYAIARVYDTELSQSQIQQNFNAQKSRFK